MLFTSTSRNLLLINGIAYLDPSSSTPNTFAKHPYVIAGRTFPVSFRSFSFTHSNYDTS